ncbi:hemolytic enterotoxin HBL [Thermosporothrix hazakensis]|jgi:DNA repair exonuclease SbcCD ATPase subunit|uniref:Hemolytic enterotoxin HBL n=1 Tax=Thermosporothrix hazakensis TaxID=644383 RepID=A0A326U203_THEHA|nr:HBL/NHE enterotoxin family protein [Thermosporothrix hazakensis]PZW25299.1 hemolytic enterotoxin HBL [Thermosporothrix hazakensis]GCE50531.1 hypothetical protein KTH_54000 [Thermosporothrix hazakensis]
MTLTQTKVILGPTVEALPLQESKLPNLLTYIYEGMKLPNTPESLASFMKTTKNEILYYHSSLLYDFKALREHCEDFGGKDRTYEKSVNVAKDIVAYSEKAKKSYNEVLQLIDEWRKEPSKEQEKKQKVKDILEARKKESQKYQRDVEAVYKGVHAFLDITQKDQKALESDESHYNQKLMKENKKLADLNEEVKKLQKEIEEKNQAVLEKVKPSFWQALRFVGVGGLGVYAYTQEVKDAIAKLSEAKEKLKKAQDEQDKYFRALTLSRMIVATVTHAQNNLRKALPELQKMIGIWSTLSKDFDTLLSKLNSRGMQEISQILTKLAVQSAIRQWEALKDKAEKYYKNAYSHGATWYSTIDDLLKAVG